MGTFRTKGEAERALQDAQVDRRRGAFVPPDRSNVRLDEYVERWFRTKVIRPATEAKYRVMLDTHVLPDLGHLPLGRIDRETVETWLADVHRRANRRTGRPLAPSTVAKAYKVLNTVMRGAVEHGYVVRNPCDVKGGGREPVNERRAPTPAEVIELADAVPARYRALVLLGGFGALRWAEAAGLRKHRVDLLHRTVRVEEQATEPVPGRHEVGRPKTDAGIRDIALPDLVIKALEEHLGRWAEPGPRGLVFPAPNGGYLRRDSFRKTVWLPACRATGVEARFHDLRHAGGTLAAQMAARTGGTLRDVMVRLGHSSPSAALRYQHAAAERDRAIAEGMDGLLAQVSTEPRAAILRVAATQSRGNLARRTKNGRPG